MRGATRSPAPFILGLGLLVVLVYLFFGVRAHLRNQQTLESIEALRGRVVAARSAVDACNLELAHAETVLRETDALADSLRRAVEAAEEPRADGSRGVDARIYDDYMATFERYNATVAEWESQASEIRAAENECADLIRRHNLIADSLRRLLKEHRIEL